MGSRKYQVYRDDSDNANNVSLPQLWVISISGNGQKLVETPFSPQKKQRTRCDWEAGVSWEAGVDWEAGCEFEVGFEGLDSEEFVVPGSEVDGEKVAAKQYPTSVSGETL
jgi:hypothetical protein